MAKEPWPSLTTRKVALMRGTLLRKEATTRKKMPIAKMMKKGQLSGRHLPDKEIRDEIRKLYFAT